ncbi:zinc-ribbon domain-containing protein [Levilactobacillus tangyuanensis]|uniref:Zinc-ribbon domain-containing protein n=1 Tax=Levilactobacillus tangyuanensis TaxID=2486021 RepID=A0ABW1TM30_9LACO|nr:zinc-ribbon domain-containing protein [Levilactobacillus tangyuanensis]
MKYCPNCGAEAADDAQFCRNCGQPLPQATETPNPQPQPQAAPKPPRPKLKPVGKRPDLYDSATAALNKYTGEEGAVKVNLIDLFSEVPKHHTKDEAEAIFISGTKTTTPELSDISDDWAKPWLFSRILLGFLLAFAALWVMAAEFQNANAIPGLILVGAFAVPFSGLVFFFEADACLM